MTFWFKRSKPRATPRSPLRLQILGASVSTGALYDGTAWERGISWAGPQQGDLTELEETKHTQIDGQAAVRPVEDKVGLGECPGWAGGKHEGDRERELSFSVILILKDMEEWKSGRVEEYPSGKLNRDGGGGTYLASPSRTFFDGSTRPGREKLLTPKRKGGTGSDAGGPGVESPTTGGGKQRPSTATSSRLHPDYLLCIRTPYNGILSAGAGALAFDNPNHPPQIPMTASLVRRTQKGLVSINPYDIISISTRGPRQSLAPSHSSSYGILGNTPGCTLSSSELENPFGKPILSTNLGRGIWRVKSKAVWVYPSYFGIHCASINPSFILKLQAGQTSGSWMTMDQRQGFAPLSQLSCFRPTHEERTHVQSTPVPTVLYWYQGSHPLPTSGVTQERTGQGVRTDIGADRLYPIQRSRFSRRLPLALILCSAPLSLKDLPAQKHLGSAPFVANTRLFVPSHAMSSNGKAAPLWLLESPQSTESTLSAKVIGMRCCGRIALTPTRELLPHLGAAVQIQAFAWRSVGRAADPSTSHHRPLGGELWPLGPFQAAVAQNPYAASNLGFLGGGFKTTAPQAT
ncbi:uncharacterized protein CLUP02_16509 [Colletotrichum lupini]|uniref:Uncharacterized protein n=1 Tax=Colletotrichum lupini TaxID=145971 RepID=A0A9Q8T821_9PEZI|nr:uncharacterized protein CLUP02_16509 [Colletotrichum lupini]UQC90976.1 hypothetical protein CLUP02_16509 [Colletotrichum lupini]